MNDKSMNIDDNQFSKLVKEIGYPAKAKRKIDVKLALAMFNYGWSYRAIGKHFGVSGMTVKRRLRGE